MIKPGVRTVGVQPQIVLAIEEARLVYKSFEQPFRITSLIEGVHSRASLHYTGCAVDIGIRGTDGYVLESDLAELIARSIKRALGGSDSDYDVILEHQRNHIHIEWQPKKPY